MPEQPLLLSSAKTGVLVKPPQSEWGKKPSSAAQGWIRTGAVVAGLVAVLVGALDIAARFAPQERSNDLTTTAFGPALVAFDPQVLRLPVATSSLHEPFVPTRLTIASLGVDARVERVSVKENGAMANPSNFTNVGWYQHGALPGEAGNAVIAGHVNNGIGLSGVFARLGEIEIGERVVVRGSEGESITYAVTKKAQYTLDNAPLEDIFTIEGPHALILITCEGDWDPETRSYDKRLVVVAQAI